MDVSVKKSDRQNSILARMHVLPPVPLEPGQWNLLFLLGLSISLGRYDTELLSLVIPFVQRDIGISEETVTSIFGLTKLGIIAGVLIGLLADRFGRVRLLSFTILGFSLAAGATAFASTQSQFVVAQFVARAFIETEAGLVVVIAVETLSPRNRGWALGFGAAFAATGAGLAALPYAFIEYLPGGWRALYAFSLIGFVLLAFIRRNLPESSRFLEAKAKRPKASLVGPLRKLLGGAYRLRLMWLALAQGIFAFGIASVFALQAKFLIETHGFRPADITILFILGGGIAVFGNIVGGLAADRFGRKPILTVSLVLTSVGAFGFFSNAGSLMVAFWILYAFSQFAAGVIFAAMEVELFPTNQRATASTLTNVAVTLGFALGAVAEGLMFTLTGSHAVGASLLALPIPLAALIVIAFLPETANRDLEEIAPDQD